MSYPEAEAQLQQELRGLFEIDTQKYLQLYFTTLEQLQSSTWQENIQQIYRCVHTIKGGAATVGAEAVLQVAAVLEDLLSDLRYMEASPPLADGKFHQILREVGEILIGSVETMDGSLPEASINRISDLHTMIKETYLSEWSEQDQIALEFAEQGFDLVILDLEMALEKLPPQGEVPVETVAIAQQTIAQLQEIGTDIQLGHDWSAQLAESQTFFDRPDCDFWQERWMTYLRSLKECAKHGGREKLAVSNQRSAVSDQQLVVSDQQEEDKVDRLSGHRSVEETIDPELWTLFQLDTQKDLQLYIRTLPQLQEATWKQDIQQLYRSVHTIKGGAVTVGAEGILQVATVLEDFLSDLRRLEVAPPLANKKLSQALLEAGELLVGSLQFPSPEAATAAVNRILELHDLAKQDYLTIFSEQEQIAQEFANQGLDLVLLDLEMAIEQLSPQTEVPSTTVEIAAQTMLQLQEIGAELEFRADWTKLLAVFQNFIDRPQSDYWLENWHELPRSLKECAKRGGKEVGESGQRSAVSGQLEEEKAESRKLIADSSLDLNLEPILVKPKTQKPPVPQQPVADIQIPVPLERLDRSSQYLIETLMASRATQGFYQEVHAKLIPLVSLAQDSAQYISQLREVQDDYALLELSTGQESPKLERYRQGYTAINRLLEISLRLIELGAETGESAHRTSESLQQLDRSLRGLQQTVEESRLVPFETLSFRTRGILRDLTTRIGKPAQLLVNGERLELDAGTLRNLEPVLLHLIRNAYDHGLEAPEERQKLGKPEQGTLELSLARRGSVFVLTLKDDGCGIDPVRIRNVAISKGLPLTNTNTPEQLLAVLCQSGFTSATQVTDVSGRGVGMDVVANQVESLGGHLSLYTELGKGTTFTIQIPVPHLFVRCMLLQAGDRIFAVPTADIFTTMLLDDLLWQRTDDPSSLHTIAIEEETGAVPALDLYYYWQSGNTQARSLLPNAIAVRTKRPDSTEGIWLVADSLIGQNELLVNSMPSPLMPPLGVMGVSLLADGKLVPVVDTVALVTALLTQPTSNSMLSQTGTVIDNKQAAIASVFEPESLIRQILVVDDAALMRRRIESSLTAQGYNVSICSDGLEAWEWLQAHPQPSLLITDIEMPGMDGFTLIDRCRQAGIAIPILVISSRLAEEWSKETSRLGATDYLTKGFSTPELLSKVAMLLEVATFV